MKKTLLVLMVAMSIIGCKKEKVEPTPAVPTTPSAYNHYKVVLDHTEFIAPHGNMGVNATIAAIHYTGSTADDDTCYFRLGGFVDPDFSGDWTTTLGHFEKEFDLPKTDTWTIRIDQSSGDISSGMWTVPNEEWLKCRIYKNGILVIDNYESNYDSTTGFYGIVVEYDN